MTRETPREDFWRRIRWKLIYYGPRREITLDVFNGLLTFDSKDWVIGRQLYVNRTYEPALIQRIPELLRQEGYLPERPRGTLVDVGANIGMTCIAMLKHGYFEKAIAFEPAPNSYRLLVHNINQNGLGGRILHYPFALSSAEGELELELSHNNSGDHRLRHSQATGNLREEKRPVLKVLVKTLDQVLADHPNLNGEDVALVWADIQGHEGQFLKGAARLLGRGIPAVCEFWPYAIGRSGVSPPDFCGIVSSLFTHFYVLHEEQLEGKQPIAGLEALFDAYTGPEGWCNLVLVRDR
jgi:FkbM family methyltransferase